MRSDQTKDRKPCLFANERRSCTIAIDDRHLGPANLNGLPMRFSALQRFVQMERDRVSGAQSISSAKFHASVSTDNVPVQRAIIVKVQMGRETVVLCPGQRTDVGATPATDNLVFVVGFTTRQK